MRISGVYVQMGIRCSKQLVLTEELFTVASSHLQIADFRMVSFFICILVCLVILNGPIFTSKATYNWGIHKAINLEEANIQRKCS